MAINKISRQDVFKIAQWVKDNWATLAELRPTQVEICDEIRQGLAMTIRPQSLRTICTAAGLKLEEITKPKKARAAAQPTQDNKLAAQLLAVVDELRRLAVWNGVKFDPESTIDRAWLAAEAAK